MKNAPEGLIHIQYDFALDGSLDYLQVWSSITRGHWLLVYAYWISASSFHAQGAHFENGYQSKGLARDLGFVMKHQNAFNLPQNLGRQGLLQISTPTPEERTAAIAVVKEGLEHLSSLLTEPALA